MRYALVLFLAAVIAISGCVSQPTGNVTVSGENKIKIGAILPLTDAIADFGRFVKDGIEFAREDINDTNLEIIYEDNQLCSTDLSVRGARKLTDVDRVSAVISMCAETALGIAPIAEDGKVVSFSVGALPDSVTQAGDYTFRNQVSAKYEGQFLSDFARSRLNATTVAIFFVKNDYGVGVKEGFKKAWIEAGGAIAAEEGSDTNDKDFRTQIAKIKAANPDVVFEVAEFHGLFAKQAKELGLNKTVLSIQTFQNPETLTSAGDAADGILYTYTLNEKNLTEKQKLFISRFKEKYGYDANVWNLNAYDALVILYDLAKKCNSDSTCMKDGLYEVKNYEGVEGTIGFDENGDVVKHLAIKTVVNGTFMVYEG
ncbi:MAG: ABC transporter substrate-binding protein [Candidatus Aenigmarchaeota archaeon]|nr:ABC transporter substrate-binding protein [Candidatus Aenigmarchaeota archaeon]